MNHGRIVVPNIQYEDLLDHQTIDKWHQTPIDKVVERDQTDEADGTDVKVAKPLNWRAPVAIDARVRTSSKRRRRSDDPQTNTSNLGRELMPAHSMPWVYEFPEIFDFYILKTPDFTGIGLYRDTLYTTEFRSSAARNPLNFTLQALLAERARFYHRRTEAQLRKFKGYALAMVNNALSDPSQQTSIDVVLSVAVLVMYDMIFDAEHGNAAAHLTGLKRLVDLRGGLEQIHPYRSRVLIAFVDAVYGYLNQTTPVFVDSPLTGRITTRADNPIRLALQPTHSQLPPWRLHNHLMVSYGAPITYLFRALAELQQLTNALLQPPYGISPNQAMHEIARLHFDFMKIGATQTSSQLKAPEFSNLDCLRHDQTVECARLVGMVVLARLNVCLKRTASKLQELDFQIQRLLVIILDPQCVIDLPILAWALVSGASLLEDGPQRDACITLINPRTTRLLPNFSDQDKKQREQYCKHKESKKLIDFEVAGYPEETETKPFHYEYHGTIYWRGSSGAGNARTLKTSKAKNKPQNWQNAESLAASAMELFAEALCDLTDIPL